ncbi:hypothetical protein [Burkholderia multivorans]|uniref:hypothetical protein n=1 Tax=Burkholderia multivorans TaxID=87883 RepID=UPI001C212951|nr:hypothetical protein [Burkholderia multivorans]MBU9212023.1 hypothetical protein [Burkholderia multivorans]
MAASEVAVAASEVAKVVAQAPAVNWWVVGASSAVIGAAVNALTSVVTQHLAWRRERAKLAEQRAPAQLEAALMLEAFARRAAGYFDMTEELVGIIADEENGEEEAHRSKFTPLEFDPSLIKDWSALPPGLISQCRELPLALEASSAWVSAAYDEWADADDAYQLDGQRAILYGLVASELAKKIRTMIDVPASDLSTDCYRRLRTEYEKLKVRYIGSDGAIELIPDLKARMMREFGFDAITGPVRPLASLQR